MHNIISIQETLRPVLPQVRGCKDYRDEEQLLERVNKILIFGGVEQRFLEKSLEQFRQRSQELVATGQRVLDGADAESRHLEQARRALRCSVLKMLVGGSYRALSKMLAMSPLYRWFCRCEDFAQIRVPGKSTLSDYAKWLPLEAMVEVQEQLRRAVADAEQARMIGLENELDLSVAWLDSTCLKACIHFPADWVLLRDLVRTLSKSILTIRRHGLRHRIGEPEEFLRAINAQSMAMAAASRRKPGGKKERKRVLRAMKKIGKTVIEHAQRYRQVLEKNWAQSDLSRQEAEVILRRMDNVLEQAPAAIKQAHERIIGERPVANSAKILSLYESDLHVIVRGKAGAEVEFGNSLFVAENAEGFIFHHELLRDQSPGDAPWLAQKLDTLRSTSGGRLCGLIADRGFASKANQRKLESAEIFDGLCPRNPRELEKRLKNDEVFADAQRRRAQCEGRIGILKNNFLEGTPRAKGFTHRSLQVSWAVLAHNLWVLARLPWAKEKEKELPQAA
jgi:hypothetical protein